MILEEDSIFVFLIIPDSPISLPRHQGALIKIENVKYFKIWVFISFRKKITQFFSFYFPKTFFV